MDKKRSITFIYVVQLLLIITLSVVPSLTQGILPGDPCIGVVTMRNQVYEGIWSMPKLNNSVLPVEEDYYLCVNYLNQGFCDYPNISFAELDLYARALYANRTQVISRQTHTSPSSACLTDLLTFTCSSAFQLSPLELCSSCDPQVNYLETCIGIGGAADRVNRPFHYIYGFPQSDLVCNCTTSPASSLSLGLYPFLLSLAILAFFWQQNR